MFKRKAKIAKCYLAEKPTILAKLKCFFYGHEYESKSKELLFSEHAYNSKILTWCNYCKKNIFIKGLTR